MVTAFRWSKRLSEAQQGKACCTDCSNGCTVERFYPVVTNGDWNEFGQAPKKTKRPQESERFHSVGKTLTNGDWNEFGQAPKSMLFQRTGAFLSWQKTARFCWKKELRSIFGTVCGGRSVVAVVASLRHRKIAKVVNLIIKTTGGVKKNRSVSLAPIGCEKPSRNSTKSSKMQKDAKMHDQ